MSCTAVRPAFIFKDILHPKLEEQRGARSWCSVRRQVLAVSWCDKKILNLLTNCYDRPRTQKKQKTKEGLKIRVPQVVEDYRASLNFVDRANAYRLRYYFQHHTNKNTRVQFNHMILLCVVNAWILYTHVNRNNTNRRLTYKEFFVQLIFELGKKGGSHRRRGRKQENKENAHLVFRSNRCQTCAYCKSQGSPNRGNCNTQCLTCGVFLHVDQKNCFAKYHGVDLP